jgi:hypothetical protein
MLTFWQLTRLIEKHSGIVYPDLSCDRLELHNLTHIISSTIDFETYNALSDLLIPVVKPEWIKASVKKGKLATPRLYSPDPKYFLSDVVLTCADLPEGDKEAIVGCLIAMGGSYTRQLTKQVTHIVAIDMDSEKCAMVKSKGLNIKTVLPHW